MSDLDRINNEVGRLHATVNRVCDGEEGCTLEVKTALGQVIYVRATRADGTDVSPEMECALKAENLI